MKLVNHSELTAGRWNTFVGQWPNFELMQSYEWGVFKEALGWKTIRLGVEQNNQLVAGVQMLIKPQAFNVASIAYVPRGPLLAWNNEAAAQLLFSAMHRIAKQHRAIVLKIEPAARYSPAMHQQLERYGFQYSTFTNQPQCSMLINLTPDEETLLANMNKTTRYNIRYSARKGVTVREATGADLQDFYQILQQTGRRAEFPVRPQTYYHQEWHIFAPLNRLKLFLAMYEGKLLAGRMVAMFEGNAATLHSASAGSAKKLKPNELLMWECIRWAKAQGCTTYDVWGIPNEVGEHHYKNKPLPANQKHGLWGVYNFKRGFGGDLVYYVGTFDYIYSKPWYWCMNLVTSRLGSLDSLAQLGDKLNP